LSDNFFVKISFTSQVCRPWKALTIDYKRSVPVACTPMIILL